MTQTGNTAALQPARHQGFTLMEILVAVAVLGIILAALYNTFFLAEKALSAADERLTALQEMRQLLDTMKREIESACLNDREHTVFKVDDRDFYGRQASQIEITSFAGPLPGLTRTRYTVEERGGRLTLRKRVSPAYPPAAQADPEDLLEEIGSLSIEVRSGDRWLKTWDSGLTRTLPSEVKLTLSLPPGPQVGAAERRPMIVLSETAVPRIGAVRR